MGLTSYEQETIINFNEEEGTASVYTAARRVADKLKRSGLSPVEDMPEWTFIVPKTAVRIKVGKRAVRIGGTHKMASMLIECGKSVSFEGI
ncbi:MAG: hypothetical protein AB1374_02910 [Bacillota bacterium]